MTCAMCHRPVTADNSVFSTQTRRHYCRLDGPQGRECERIYRELKERAA